MRNIQILINEIVELTTTIATNYPELYVFLSEDTVTIPSEEHPKMTKKVMKTYLEGLKQMLQKYSGTYEERVKSRI